MAPGYLEEMFTYNTAEYSLRSTDAQKLLLPKARLEIFKKSFQYSGPKIWNSIPYTYGIASHYDPLKKNVLLMYTHHSNIYTQTKVKQQ